MPRSLAPKEHGAYGQLALPLLAALASVRPTLAAVAFALAAGLAFAAHEPLLLALGHRGPRALEEDGARARARLLALGLAALAAAAGAALLAPRAALLGALLPIALAAALAPLLARRLERSLPGELLAASALAAAALPVGLAAGLPLPAALASWAAWALGFAATTASVRGVIARQKGHEEPVLAALLLPTVALAAAPIAHPAGTLVLAGAPLALSAWASHLARPHPRALRRIGWALVGASAATAAWLVAAVRLGAGP